MQLGALVPLGDIGGDPVVVRDYAQQMEGMGYDFVEAPDHVLGVNAASRPGWDRNDNEDLFHDPFVLGGFLAGCTHEAGLLHRRADPAAAADGAGGEAGGVPRRAVRGEIPAGHRRRLERGGVRRPEREFP